MHELPCAASLRNYEQLSEKCHGTPILINYDYDDDNNNNNINNNNNNSNDNNNNSLITLLNNSLHTIFKKINN